MKFTCIYCEEEFDEKEVPESPYICSNCGEMYENLPTPPEEMIDHDPGL